MTESSFKEADGDGFWEGKGVVELWKEFWILWNLRLSSTAATIVVQSEGH